MKRIIVIIAVLAMVFVNCGFTYDKPRAIDYSEVIEELEDEGFTRRGDVWTYEMYEEDNLEWIVAWYDMIDNYGVVTIYGNVDDSDYSKRVSYSGRFSIEWDWEESEFVMTDIREFRR